MYESEAFLSRIDGIQFNLLFFFATHGMFHLLGWGAANWRRVVEREKIFFKKKEYILELSIIRLVIITPPTPYHHTKKKDEERGD